SNVHLTGSASVHATATDDASADATGASIAAGSAGSTNAEAVLQPTVNAFVGSNAVLGLGGGLDLEAVNATSQGVSANASASQGSLLGGNGATADARGGASVDAHIGPNASITAAQTVTVHATSTNKVSAEGDGDTIGLLVGVGSVSATARDTGA